MSGGEYKWLFIDPTSACNPAYPGGHLKSFEQSRTVAYYPAHPSIKGRLIPSVLPRINVPVALERPKDSEYRRLIERSAWREIRLSFSPSTTLDPSANAFSGSINFVRKQRRGRSNRERERESLRRSGSNASEMRSEIDSATECGARLLADCTRVRSMLSGMECENTATATRR